jgi:hypothetical protein
MTPFTPRAMEQMRHLAQYGNAELKNQGEGGWAGLRHGIIACGSEEFIGRAGSSFYAAKMHGGSAAPGNELPGAAELGSVRP